MVVGKLEGFCVGCMLGICDGDELGEKDETDGLFVGLIEGLCEGVKLNLKVGDADALSVGKMENFCVGCILGPYDGEMLGEKDDIDGILVGSREGLCVD